MVRLVEFEKEEMPYDLANDVKVYMLNDKNFYRKQYYPCMVKLQSNIKRSAYDPVADIESMVKKGCGAYCKKYDANPKLFDKDFMKNLVNDILKDETPRLRKGEY